MFCKILEHPSDLRTTKRIICVVSRENSQALDLKHENPPKNSHVRFKYTYMFFPYLVGHQFYTKTLTVSFKFFLRIAI